MQNQDGDLLYLSILKDGLPIFEQNFSVKGMEYDAVLLSGFVTAIKDFSEKFSNRELKVIDQGDLKLIFEDGTKISVCAIVSSVSEELRSKIRILIRDFESKYIVDLNSLKNIYEFSKFDDFKERVVSIFSQEILKPYYVVKLSGTFHEELIPEKYRSIIPLINSTRTVEQITMNVEENADFIKHGLIWLKEHKMINFEVKFFKQDIPKLTKKGSSELVSSLEQLPPNISTMGNKIFDIIKIIDGRKTILQLEKKIKIDFSKLDVLLDFLLKKNIIEIIPEKDKCFIILETYLTNLKKEINRIIGKKGIKIINDVYEKVSLPMFKLADLSESAEDPFKMVKMQFSGKRKIHELFDAFIPPTVEVFMKIENLLGQKYNNRVKNSIFDKLKDIFGSQDIEKILEYFK